MQQPGVVQPSRFCTRFRCRARRSASSGMSSPSLFLNLTQSTFQMLTRSGRRRESRKFLRMMVAKG